MVVMRRQKFFGALHVVQRFGEASVGIFGLVTCIGKPAIVCHDKWTVDTQLKVGGVAKCVRYLAKIDVFIDNELKFGNSI